MRQAWAEFLRSARPRSHGAQVYAAPAELAESVVAYVATGFERNQPAVLVVAAEHLALLSEGLGTAGWDVGALQRSGLLVVADAEATLAAIMEGGSPSPERFEATVAELLDTAARSDDHVRVFGEMVDVLCRRGDHASARELEQLWNVLAERRGFSLLCGYRLDVFDEYTQRAALGHICREHTHVLPARNYPRFARAVDDALREVLGPSETARVYKRVSRVAEDQQVPLAQLLLLWVTKNMPRQSAPILDSARGHYARAA